MTTGDSQSVQTTNTVCPIKSQLIQQLFRMDGLGAGRINGNRAQYSALLHQTCKSAVTGSPRRLTRPSQPAHRRAVPACQQSIQRVDLRRKQASGQLIGDLALGKRRLSRGNLDRSRIASPENVPQTSSVASPPVFPLPH